MTKVKISCVVALITLSQWTELASGATEVKKTTQQLKSKSDKNEEKLHTASQSLFGYNNNNNGIYSGSGGGFSGLGGGYSPGFGGQSTSGFLPNYASSSGLGGGGFSGGPATNSLGGGRGPTGSGFSGLGQSGLGQGGFTYPGQFGSVGSSGFNGLGGSSGFGGIGSSGFGGVGSSGFGGSPSYLNGGQGYFGGAGNQFGTGVGLNNYPQFGFGQQGQGQPGFGQQDRNLGFVNQAFGNPIFNRQPAVSNVQPGLGSLQVGNRIDVNSASRGYTYIPSGGAGGFTVADQRRQAALYPMMGFGAQQFGGLGGAQGFNSLGGGSFFPGGTQGGIYAQNPSLYPSQLDYLGGGGRIPLRSGAGGSSTPPRVGGPTTVGTRLGVGNPGVNRFYQGTNPAGAFQRGDRIHRFTSSNSAETTK